MGLLAWRSAELQPWTLDDSYISFRYAENWASGQGLVFNVGERVEGFTCFLWVALLALGNLLGAPIEGLSKVLGAGFSVGALAALASAYRWVPGIDARASAAAALALGGCGMFTGWALSGMEVALIVFLVLLSWLLHWSGRPAATGLVGALAAMSRPDALLVPIVQGVELMMTRQWSALARHVGVGVGLFGPYWAARWAYYGWPFPNTFYAKVGSSADQLERGLIYVTESLPTLAPLLLPVLLLPWVPGGRRFGSALLWMALHAAYVVSVGGDVMPAYRFLVALLGPMALIGGVALGRWALAAVPLVVCSVVWAHVSPELSSRILNGNVGRHGREVGLWLAQTQSPDTLVATNTAGSIPYFSKLPAIDMLGLCDEHIAHSEVPNMGRRRAGHEKGDGAYVLAREPDLIIFGAARGRKKPVFRSDRELYANKDFKRRYLLRSHLLPSGATLWMWHRRD